MLLIVRDIFYVEQTENSQLCIITLHQKALSGCVGASPDKALALFWLAAEFLGVVCPFLTLHVSTLHQ